MVRSSRIARLHGTRKAVVKAIGEEDFAYGTVGPPDYLKPFSTIYLSQPLPKDNGRKDWEKAFEQVGTLTDTSVVLPLPQKRAIRLLYPDGRPLADVSIPISLYGSSENHHQVVCLPFTVWKPG